MIKAKFCHKMAFILKFDHVGENRNMCWNYHLTDNYTFIYDTIRLLIAHLKPVPIDLLKSISDQKIQRYTKKSRLHQT